MRTSTLSLLLTSISLLFSHCAPSNPTNSSFTSPNHQFSISHDPTTAQYHIQTKSSPKSILSFPSLISREKLANNPDLPQDQSILWTPTSLHAVISEDISTPNHPQFGYWLISLNTPNPTATFLPKAPKLINPHSNIEHHGSFPTISSLTDNSVTFSWFDASTPKTISLQSWKNQHKLNSHTNHTPAPCKNRNTPTHHH